LVSRTITTTIVRANRRVNKGRDKRGAGHGQNPIYGAIAPADNRIAAPIPFGRLGFGRKTEHRTRDFR
jgi:hypothetical protein